MQGKKRTVGIIGIGHVGAHVAYSLAVQGIADEIILVDRERKKADCEAQDVMDSVCYLPHRVEVRSGDFPDLKDCDVLVNSAGHIQLLATGNKSRLEEMDFTIRAVNGYVDRVMESGFDGVVINVTNPCDVVAWRFAELSGLPQVHLRLRHGGARRVPDGALVLGVLWWQAPHGVGEDGRALPLRP